MGQLKITKTEFLAKIKLPRKVRKKGDTKLDEMDDLALAFVCIQSYFVKMSSKVFIFLRCSVERKQHEERKKIKLSILET